MAKDAIQERFFTALISGQRDTARQIVDELLQADCPAPSILGKLFWPTLDQVQKLYRHDQMSMLSFNFATRLMRNLVDQMQLRLERRESRGKSVLVVCGPEESEELGTQMVADLLEADGYDVFFAGGGIANDEIVSYIGQLNINTLLVFGAVPSTVPFTRLLIDQLHEIGAAPKLQVVVGGGVFNRADGLAEEIGADLWAQSPEDVVQVMNDNPDRRMTEDQRTVGRKRRTRRETAAA
ncbi:MAG: cobalamin-dependent protein [Phycisphaeraceae bacterium]|nr:cobalamin-dependent protein [Phycisphaeraceae bacterium]